MSQPTNTILAIFAHPDDEIGVGSTLASYSDAGVRTVLACATRGEAATIFCEDCATRESLAEVRTRELACACSHLGIGELRWLDWPDGGVKDLPRAAAIGQIVRLIREIRPVVIFTHPENGLYPHPDHLAIWEMVREAFDAAADPARYPEAGSAWAAARLFTRAIPQSFFERAPGLADFRVQLNGQQLPFFGTPDAEIDVSMRVAPWMARRMAAWDCHKSQHNPKGFTSSMSDAMRQEMAANEHFVLAAGRPLPEGVHDDLFAGLTDQPADVEATPAAIAALGDELARHRALVALCQEYQLNQPEAKFAQLVRRLADGEHEMIYRLSRALRDAGAAAGAIEMDARLHLAGRRRDSTPQRVAFLRNLTAETVSRCQAQAGQAAPQQKAAWEELITLAQEQAAVVAAFVE